MAVAKGSEAFQADVGGVVARGFQYSETDLEDARADRIPSLLADHDGLGIVEAVCDGLELTNFGSDALAAALQPFPQEDHSQGWKEGEALAEAWLVDHEGCEFPWSFNRDLRHPRASMPGAEFVGFTGEVPAARFAFGQVKTSKELKSPPQVVTNGAKSLIQQMLDLRDNFQIKVTLFRYLAMRAPSALWGEKFRCATVAYLESSYFEMAIFGVLVRDTPPQSSDLGLAATKLSEKNHAKTVVKFSGLYLPSDSILPGPQHKARASKGKQA